MRYKDDFNRKDTEVVNLRRANDYGPNPFIVDIEEVTKQNNYFRTALWTGKYLQLTLMSLNPQEDIGGEVHNDLDQFLRIEEGQGVVMLGNGRNQNGIRRRVGDDDVIIIPAGTWHNLINTGRTPMKLYSIYAPPAHPYGTVHPTKRDASNHH
ncbi:MAG: cupin domain-containing protein [Clostridiales bacterium]|jgi:mannose-6-phosphate isomerase-like protein (cupin superfamily)|nr:cupin domain-containing protein [Clostridiales bacterium]